MKWVITVLILSFVSVHGASKEEELIKKVLESDKKSVVKLEGLLSKAKTPIKSKYFDILAQYYYKNDKLDTALKKYLSKQKYSKNNLTSSTLPYFLYHAELLAFNTKLRESLKRIEYAEKTTEGYLRALAITKKADVDDFLKKYKSADARYKSAINYGNSFYKSTRISHSEKPKKVAGSDTWKKVKKYIEAKIRALKDKIDIEKYGLGWFKYKKARGFHLGGKHKEAMTIFS